MKKYYVLGLIVALSTVLAVPRVHAAGPSSVVFSEIAWAGSQKSTADEWIELANLGSGSVDVSGWTMTGLATSGGVLTIPANTSIAAGGTYLVANYKVGSSSTLLIPPDLVTTAVSIPNTALDFALLDATGNVIDSLDDPGTPNAGSNTTFATMERNMGDLSWVTAEVSTNLDGEQLGSPGIVGHLVAPMIEAPATSEPASAGPAAVADPIISEPVVVNSNSVVASTVEVPSDSAPSDSPMSGGEDTTEPIIAAPDETVSEPTVTSDSSATVVAVTASETELLATAPTETAVSAPNILITSLLPSPNTGDNETLTLTNVGDAAVSLDGFTLVDASGKVTALSGSIEAGGSFTVINPSGNLNNDGDSITLFDASGTQIDVVTYGTDEVPAPKKNVELQLIDGVWGTVSEAPSDSPMSGGEDTIETIPNVPELAIPVLSDELVVLGPSDLLVEPVVTAPTESPTDPVVITPTNPSTTPVDLAITSLLPAPSTGGDEWVEITNRGTADVDLSVYSLVDASGAVTTLSGTLVAGATTTILNPKGNLNNDSDSVTLMDAAGAVIDSVTYGGDVSSAPKKDEVVTFASFSPTIYDDQTTGNPTDTTIATTTTSSGSAATSTVATTTSGSAATHSVSVANSVVKTPTPKTATVKTTAKTSSSSTKSTKKASATARNVSIDEIASLADNTPVTLEGTVVAAPGVIGKRSFFVDGLEVYQSQDDLAAVSIGDHVRITGTVSVLSDHRRVNIKADGVAMLGTSTPIVHDYAAGLPYGSLVRVTGTVSARDGSAVVLATDAGNVTVTLGNGVTMKWTDLAGKKVTVTGVLKSSNESATVVLRSAEDVVVAPETMDAASTAAGTSAAQNFPWTVVGLAGLSLAGLAAWFWRMKPRSSLTALTLKPNTV